MADLVVSITRILLMLFNVILHFGCAIEYYFSPLSSADHEAPKIDCMMTALGHLTLGISLIGLGIAGKYGELSIVVLSYLWVLIAEVWLLWRGKQYNEYVSKTRQ